MSCFLLNWKSTKGTRGLKVSKSMFSFFVCRTFIFQTILMISFFIFFTKFSWYKMPTNFVWLLPFSKYKGVEMGSTSKNKPNFDRVFFLPSSNGFWDIMSQRELNDTNAEKFVSCMSQQICCSSDSFRDMIGSIVTNSQHFLFSF